MARIRRMEQAGAVFTEDLSSVNSLRKRQFQIVGNPAGTDGPVGKALDFDGAADYITLGADIESLLRFDGSTQDFSISAWVKRDVTGVANAIFDKRDSDNDGYLFFIGSDDAVKFLLNDKDAASTATITDTNWHHLAVTADRDGNSQIYIDGSADGSVALSSSSLATTRAPRIGAISFDATGKFNGAIKNLMVFDRVLTAAEITDLATNNPFDYEKNVVSEWDMSDINPADVGYRGLGNDGTQTSLTAASIVNGIAGGKAITFDGIADLINIGTSATLAPTTAGSFTFWIKADDVATEQYIIDRDINTTGLYAFILRSDATVDFVVRANGLKAVADAPIVDSVWTHFVGTWNDADDIVILYQDGAFLGSTSLSGETPTDGGDNLRFAESVGAATKWFNGAIDKVIIFDKALTSLEVSDLYNRQRSGRR